MKRILSLALSLLLLTAALCVPAAAQAETPLHFTVAPFAAESARVGLWLNAADGAYYLFLPGGADPAALTAHVNRSTAVDGAYLSDGAVTDALTPGRHTLSVAGTDYTLYVIVSGDLPSVFLTTESGSMDAINADKEHKEKGTITVVEDGVVTIDAAALKSVKGRGNYTWNYEKKPYNIKFEKSTDLFGMGKAKKWSLLANWIDDTLVRNKLAFDFADRLGIDYASKSQSVDLYANGEYLGNYLVSESVEVGSNRVEITDLDSLNEDANPDIDDLESLPQRGTGVNGAVEDGSVKGSMKWVDIPNTPADITGGYLLEVDFHTRYNEEKSGFVSNRGQCVVLKSPELASEAQVRYIAGLWNEMEEALWSDTGYNSLGKHYSDYLDISAFAKSYILEELTMDIDAALSSFFFYKDSDSDLLVAAPVWDFDGSLGWTGTRVGMRLNNYHNWFANSLSYCGFVGSVNDIETILVPFFRHEENREVVASIWNSVIAGESESIDNNVAQLLNYVSLSYIMNSLRWKQLGYQDMEQINSQMAQAGADLREFLTGRIGVLDQAFSDSIAMLYYDSNGAEGHVFNREIVHVGEKVSVLSSKVNSESKLTPPENMKFKCWNTKADGTGTDYAPGDRIALTGKTTTLYAQFEPTGKICPYDGKVHTGPLKTLVYFIHRILAFFRNLFR